MVDLFLFMLRGSTIIATVWMAVTLGRLALHEAVAQRWQWQQLRSNQLFLISIFLVGEAVGGGGNSALRGMDAVRGVDTSGSWPHLLFLTSLVIWISRAGFVWAAMIGRSRTWWWWFVICEAAWMGYCLGTWRAFS